MARSAGRGVARCFAGSRIARPAPRTCCEPYLLSTPHPAFGHLPRFARKLGGSVRRGKPGPSRSMSHAETGIVYHVPVSPQQCSVAFTQVDFTLSFIEVQTVRAPFSAKRGRCRVAADGVWKAGMAGRNFAVRVMQCDLRRSSGPYPIRRSAPPSPAELGKDSPADPRCVNVVEPSWGRDSAAHRLTVLTIASSGAPSGALT